MDIKTAKDELKRLKSSEKSRTLEYIKLTFGRHSHIIDLSNHYLFKQSISVLCSMFKKQGGSYKQLTLKNCMLTGSALKKILKSMENSSLRILDIANNRLVLTPKLAFTISTFFATKNKPVSMILQGTLFPSADAFTKLVSYQFPIQELNLYDCSLSDSVITAISETLARGKQIQRLVLAFNSSILCTPEVIQSFATAVAANECLEYLDLSGIENLDRPDHLEVLCKYMAYSRSLQTIAMASIGFDDSAVSLLCGLLLAKMPVLTLNIQNNRLTATGISELFHDLPESLTSLDVSYNEISDPSALIAISSRLKRTRSLSSINISHTIQIDELDDRVIEKFCKSITDNDSLTELLCEGVKIGENPDGFCSLVNHAISVRILSLTYNISVVNCNPHARSTILGNLSLSDTPEQCFSTIGSRSPSLRSHKLTDKQKTSRSSKNSISTSKELFPKQPDDFNK